LTAGKTAGDIFMRKINLNVFWMFIALAVILFASCEEPAEEKSSFEKNSPWTMDDGSKLTFSSDSWEWVNETIRDKDKGITWDFKGGYTYNGNNATMYVTHCRNKTQGHTSWSTWTETWYAEIDGNRISIKF
jgi:hypothetical protein